MYSIIFHAHQKLDRVAYRHLLDLLPDDHPFPTIKQVLNFEGSHGPDGAKLKRLRGGQPWHFVDPLDASDTELHSQIFRHYQALVKALSQSDDVRAAFEGAWLAHALVDGLTPAHHFPYEAELSRLRGGKERDSRKGLAGRLYVKGDTISKSVLQSLKLVGPKGLLTTHAMFEAGAYALILPLRFKKALPSRADIARIEADGVIDVFKRTAREVAEFNLYERFYALGWTQPVSRDVRRELAPRMVRMVTLAWYAAYLDASASKGPA
jgi:hypothetical protein